MTRWRLTVEEPTQAMMDVLWDSLPKNFGFSNCTPIGTVKAIIAASPPPDDALREIVAQMITGTRLPIILRERTVDGPPYYVALANARELADSILRLFHGEREEQGSSQSLPIVSEDDTPAAGVKLEGER